MGATESEPSARHPFVTLVPYLPLAAPISFAGWWLGPLESFDGPWLSDEFEDQARLLASVFRDTSGKPLKRPSILVRQADGADGVPPTPEEYRCLQLAVAFAVIHQNIYWSPDAQGDSWRVATSDNAVIWAQPLDLAHGYITLGRGARVQTMAGGHRLGDPAFSIQPPLELHMPVNISLDTELLEAVYTVLLEPPAGSEHVASSVSVAIRWLIKSWQNTPSITWEDRLVFVKVATEALTGKERNHESAAKLVEIFRQAETQEGEGVGLECLLWRADQQVRDRTYLDRGRPKTVTITELEHWACALGDARNAVVHADPVTQHVYFEEGSPYNGPFVEIGDRVVREAITVVVGSCGYPAVWRRGMSRTSLAVYRHLIQAREEETL